MRGIVFFGVLVAASVLLSPTGLFALLPPQWKLWMVRRWSEQLFRRAMMLLATLFFALCTWLVGSVPQDRHENATHTQGKISVLDLSMQAGKSAPR